jgi:7-cyano-7-deazaguanine synthase
LYPSTHTKDFVIQLHGTSHRTAPMHITKALVVLSGGQDSTTCLYWAIQHYGKENVHAVTFDYGQRHSRELEAAAFVAGMSGIEPYSYKVVKLGAILEGRSPLTNPAEPLEQYANHDQMAAVIGERVELTFVPMRNALFLTLAGNLAAARGLDRIVTGVCQADNANYPDCRRSFVLSQEDTINMALGHEEFEDGKWITIDTPLMDMTKRESIRLALALPGCYRALAYSHTAYDGRYPPVGSDHATILRAHGFKEAGVPDPLVLRAIKEGLMDWPDTDNYRALAINEVVDRLSPTEIPDGWAR